MNRNKDSLQKAKNYAFLLLKFRLRSERELFERLKRKKFDVATIGETLAFLKDKDFIDDIKFTRGWIEARAKKPFGLRRIKNELLSKGVKKEVIEDELQNFKDKYCETEVIEDIIEAKLAKLKKINPDKVKSRLYGYLLRRGFSPELTIEAINKLWKQNY